MFGGGGAAAAADAFTISGDTASSLYPGGSDTLDLALTNVSSGQLTVGEITVSIVGVTTQPQRQCLVGDFAVTQLDPALQFALPANATLTLSQLGVAATDLPRVSMTNTPVNQDGCKNSTVNLAFNGRAAGVGGVALPSPTPTPAVPDEQPPAVSGETLPDTGASGPPPWMVAFAGLGLVGAGGGSVFLARRRNPSANAAGHARRTI